MNLQAFLDHWQIIENPFRGEEARQDPVFSRLMAEGADASSPAGQGVSRISQHSDYEKIAGDFARPGAGIAFGEKGSGKTAIRLQLAHQAAVFNGRNPNARILLLPYDDLGAMLERFHRRIAASARGKNKPTPSDTLKQIRLSDHIDAMLASVVPQVIDAVLGHGGPGALDLGPDPRKSARREDRAFKRDLMVLQAAYDRPEQVGERAYALRKSLGVRKPIASAIETFIALVGWVLPLAVFAVYEYRGGGTPEPLLATVFFATLGVWLLFLFKKVLTDRLALGRRAHRLWKQIRTTPRTEASFKAAVRQLPPAWRHSLALPSSDGDEPRLAMLDRLRRVLRRFGFHAMLVVIDRVDEPSILGGDVERMKAVIWPLLSNRFLQHEGLAVKMLLPIELRHVLFRESGAFFQEARLDKQSLVESLGWTGPMLYDLCTNRLNACRRPGSQSITLADLFDDALAREELIAALELMRQPRDAFKLLYQCLADHCAAVTADQGAWKMSKATLDAVKKQHVERIRQLAMGVRPA